MYDNLYRPEKLVKGELLIQSHSTSETGDRNYQEKKPKKRLEEKRRLKEGLGNNQEEKTIKKRKVSRQTTVRSNN